MPLEPGTTLDPYAVTALARRLPRYDFANKIGERAVKYLRVLDYQRATNS